MFRFLLCLFGLHGATEIDYTIDDEEIKLCRYCLKEFDQNSHFKLNKQINNVLLGRFVVSKENILLRQREC